MKIKVNESQLRQLIKETLNEMIDETRPRIKPSYWEKEDYRDVEGMELYIPDPMKMRIPQLRDPERLKNKLLDHFALYATVDDKGGVHAYFYNSNSHKYIEGCNAWDEDAWYECMNAGPMKGIAKQIPVLLYQHVPNFEKRWAEQREFILRYRKAERQAEEERDRHKESVGAYAVFPTIGTMNETKLTESIKKAIDKIVNKK